MDKDSLFANPKVGLFIKILASINSIAIVFILVSVQENLPYIAYWPWLVLSTPLMFYLLWKHYNAFNMQLDKLVTGTLAGDNNNIPTMLYLRPFVSDGADIYLGKQGTFDFLFALPHIVDTGGVFEGKLLPVIYKKYIPIKFDHSPKKSAKSDSRNPIYKFNAMLTYRFGRYFDSTEQWLDTVRKIAKNCAICIIVPPTKIDSSTAEEISMALKYSLLGKLVFVMPSKKSRLKTEEGVKVVAKQLWENLLQTTKDKIKLPNYSENGGFVLQVNGQMMLIESCHGFDWPHKKAMQKIFIDGKLTCSLWLGSLKITTKLVWLYFPLSFLYTYLIYNVFVDTVSPPFGDDVMGVLPFLAFLVIFSLHMKAFYRFCSKFLLSKVRVIGLFISSIVSFTIGTVIAIYLLIENWGIFLIDTLGLSWITKPEFGSNDYALSYSLFGVVLSLCIASIFVYLTACLFFLRQPSLEFKAVSTNRQ